MFLWVISPYYHFTISVRTLKEAQSSDPNLAWSHHSFIHQGTPKAKGVAPFTQPLQIHYHSVQDFDILIHPN